MAKERKHHGKYETNWGCELCDGKFMPLWMTQGEASQECCELVKCSFKKLCTGRCRCKKAELPCTELCHEFLRAPYISDPCKLSSYDS